MFKRIAIIVVALWLGAGQPMAAASVQVGGAVFAPFVEIQNKRLPLYGYGLLKVMVFIKAYAGALYLGDPAMAGDVLGPVAKRLELEYFHAIKKEDFAQATRSKIADNTDEKQAAQLQSRIDRLAAMYRDVSPGDRYALTFIPGTGTELALNGQTLGVIAGEDFARAVFAIWLGSNPIDRGFRDTLLRKS